MSLSGLVSHVRRSHRQELKEVPGAIEGRTSLSVEVSAMNGIPQEALDEFNEQLAEEMGSAGHDDHAPPPRRDEAEDKALPPLPRDDFDEPSRPAMKPGLPMKPGVVANLLLAHAGGKSLAEQVVAKQQQQQQEQPPEPEPEEVQRKSEVMAFDPSLLAERLAGVNVPAPEPVEKEENAAARAAVERAREQLKEREREEERARKDEEDRRKKDQFLGSIAKDEKHEEVVKVDKSVVQAMGSAFAARAAAAAAAEAKNRAAMPKPYKGEPIDTAALRTKLSMMEKNNLFKHAVGVGVHVEEIRSACAGKSDQLIKETIVNLVLKLEAEENWVVCTFKPGKLGITADWISATVKQITEGGQAASNGSRVGMVFKTIDGKKYAKSLLVDKLGGRQNFDVVFATNPKPRPPVYEEEEDDYSDEEEAEDDGPPPVSRAPTTTAERDREAAPVSSGRDRDIAPAANARDRERSRSRSPKQQPPVKSRSGGVKDETPRRRDEYDSYHKDDGRDYRDDGRDYKEGRDYRDDRRDYRDEGRDHRDDRDYRDDGRDYRDDRRDYRDDRDRVEERVQEREGRRRRGRREEERGRDDEYYEEEDWQEERHDDRRRRDRDRQVRPRR